MLHTRRNATHPTQCYTPDAMLHTRRNATHPTQCYTPDAMLHTRRNATHPTQCSTFLSMPQKAPNGFQCEWTHHMRHAEWRHATPCVIVGQSLGGALYCSLHTGSFQYNRYLLRVLPSFVLFWVFDFGIPPQLFGYKICLCPLPQK